MLYTHAGKHQRGVALVTRATEKILLAFSRNAKRRFAKQKMAVFDCAFSFGRIEQYSFQKGLIWTLIENAFHFFFTETSIFSLFVLFW